MSQQALDGMPAREVRITLLGAAVNLDDQQFALGDAVSFTIKGHVTMEGEEALETEGVRRVVKVRCDVIEVQP